MKDLKNHRKKSRMFNLCLIRVPEREENENKWEEVISE